MVISGYSWKSIYELSNTANNRSVRTNFAVEEASQVISKCSL